MRQEKPRNRARGQDLSTATRAVFYLSLANEAAEAGDLSSTPFSINKKTTQKILKLEKSSPRSLIKKNS
jgi:hypothetical protein